MTASGEGGGGGGGREREREREREGGREDGGGGGGGGRWREREKIYNERMQVGRKKRIEGGGKGGHVIGCEYHVGTILRMIQRVGF